MSEHTEKKKSPKLGPEPTLLSRSQVDALYTLLQHVTDGLKQLEIPYILTGGSLLGAIRQHSILFCDDDIDLAILETEENNGNCHNYYERAKSELPALLGDQFQYSVRPWEGGDKVRIKSCSNVFLDLFVIRKYNNIDELVEVIGVKKNGDPQSDDYVREIVGIINNSLHSQGEIQVHALSTTDTETFRLSFPIWHFSTRKAIELWPKEVYRDCELFPVLQDLKMGPVIGLSGPQTPVWLLQRAFGSDCFEVYYQSMSHGRKCTSPKTNSDKEGLLFLGEQAIKQTHLASSSSDNLPPLVKTGGQWTQSVKTPLLNEHFIPMQPVSKARRRYTLHSKSTLFEYLDCQKEFEWKLLRQQGILTDDESNSDENLVLNETCNESTQSNDITISVRPRCTVYMDGVFDLFHIGHLQAIQQCAALGDRVIIGVTGAADASGYKRSPIISESDRTAIVKSLKVVDDVVCPCPLVVTKEFMKEWDIDLVVHGFANPKDKDRQREFFQVAMDQGKFQEIDYYSQLSTTDIIRRIRADDEVQKKNIDTTSSSTNSSINPKWFGSVLTAATNKSAFIEYDPFPFELRSAIEPQLRKATKKRQDALHAVRQATATASLYDATMSQFNSCYSNEGMFAFDTSNFQFLENFIQSCSLPPNFDLSQLHQTHESRESKDEILFSFARNRHRFQELYDDFVRSVCCPFVASLAGEHEPVNEIYYQSFPCVRIVRPGEFSIGPHADSAYGHHPCSINFYIPLTRIEGSASLFLESRPGSEDWHPIEGAYGFVKHFAGAICAHWTPENNTDFTRISLDFRIIPGPLYHTLQCGGGRTGGVRDVYREKEGYYHRCYKNEDDSSVSWVREAGSFQTPDARFGFPWTKFKA